MDIKRRLIAAGEALAIYDKAVHLAPGAFFWPMGPEVKPNERRGDIAVVHVRGALEHHLGGYGDSYEGIYARVLSAMNGLDAKDGGKPTAPPKAVVLCLDSPGGVVSGLNETVYALRKLRRETGIPLIAYVNEMAASAAYALACSCERIVAPPSAILGSIGVISTMVSQSQADKAAGLDIRMITSGEAKADGHPHAPITDAAENRERARVMQLAKAFFKLASRARGVSIQRIRDMQAAIFLAKDAEKQGLADAVMSLDDTLLALSSDLGGDPPKAGNTTDRRAKLDNAKARLATSSTSGVPMDLQLKALIAKTKSALAKEQDSVKRVALATALANFLSALESYKKTKKHVEHYETEEDDKDDEDDDVTDKDDDEDEEDDEDEKKSEEKAAASKKEEKKGAKCEEEEEEAEEAEEAKAVLSLVRAATGGKLRRGALQAILDRAESVSTLEKRINSLESASRKDERATMLAQAQKENRITPAIAAKLAKRSLDDVRWTLANLYSKPLVAGIGEEAHVPDGTPHGDLGADVLKSIELAVTAANLAPDKAQSMRDALIKSHRERRAVNGAGRY